MSGHPRELARAPEDSEELAGPGALPSGSAAPPESAQCSCCGRGCWAYTCRWLDRRERVRFLSLSFHICQMGRLLHRVVERAVREALSGGGPAPEKDSGNPWPQCQCFNLDNGEPGALYWVVRRNP